MTTDGAYKYSLIVGGVPVMLSMQELISIPQARREGWRVEVISGGLCWFDPSDNLSSYGSLPAVRYFDSQDLLWFKDGKLSRLGAPAVVFGNGEVQYWERGARLQNPYDADLSSIKASFAAIHAADYVLSVNKAALVPAVTSFAKVAGATFAISALASCLSIKKRSVALRERQKAVHSKV